MPRLLYAPSRAVGNDFANEIPESERGWYIGLGASHEFKIERPAEKHEADNPSSSDDDAKQFFYQGSNITFYGSTFYPSAIGGTSAWHTTSFPTYIDQMIELALQGGLNILRPSDFFFTNRPGKTPTIL